MRQRLEERLPKRLMVSFGDAGFELIGITNNISKGGLFIETHKPMSSRNEINVRVASSGNEFIIKGEVRWLKKPLEKENSDTNGGMGVRILEAPIEYYNYVEYSKYDSMV
jgi:Tfp pilus assembly protein PilZ